MSTKSSETKTVRHEHTKTTGAGGASSGKGIAAWEKFRGVESRKGGREGGITKWDVNGNSRIITSLSSDVHARGVKSERVTYASLGHVQHTPCSAVGDWCYSSMRGELRKKKKSKNRTHNQINSSSLFDHSQGTKNQWKILGLRHPRSWRKKGF